MGTLVLFTKTYTYDTNRSQKSFFNQQNLHNQSPPVYAPSILSPTLPLVHAWIITSPISSTMTSFVARAALYAGRNLFGTRALAAASATVAAAFGSTVALADKTERSYIMLKPDAVQRGLVGDIISRFERRGFKLVALKLVTPSLKHAQKHYYDLAERPFFPALCAFLSSGPVVAMVFEGEDVIRQGYVFFFVNPNIFLSCLNFFSDSFFSFFFPCYNTVYAFCVKSEDDWRY